MRVISVAYLAFAPEMPEAAAGHRRRRRAVVPGRRATRAARLRPRADPRRRGRAGQGQARVHPAGDRVRHASRSPISELREVYETVWGEKLHAGQLPPQGAVRPRVRRVHRRPDRDRRPARRPAGQALPPRRRHPAAPGPAPPVHRGRGPALTRPAVSRPSSKGDRHGKRLLVSRCLRDRRAAARRQERLRLQRLGARSVHPSLDPFDAGKRESRDSGEHPQSLAIAVLFDVTGSMGACRGRCRRSCPGCSAC